MGLKMILDSANLVVYKVVIKIQTINKKVHTYSETKTYRNILAHTQWNKSNLNTRDGIGLLSAKTEATNTYPTHDTKYITTPPLLVSNVDVPLYI